MKNIEEYNGTNTVWYLYQTLNIFLYNDCDYFRKVRQC